MLSCKKAWIISRARCAGASHNLFHHSITRPMRQIRAGLTVSRKKPGSSRKKLHHVALSTRPSGYYHSLGSRFFFLRAAASVEQLGPIMRREPRITKSLIGARAETFRSEMLKGARVRPASSSGSFSHGSLGITCWRARPRHGAVRASEPARAEGTRSPRSSNRYRPLMQLSAPLIRRARSLPLGETLALYAPLLAALPNFDRDCIANLEYGGKDSILLRWCGKVRTLLNRLCFFTQANEKGISLRYLSGSASVITRIR